MRFSNRFPKEDENSPSTFEVNPHWQARQARVTAKLPLLDLTISNPTLVGLKYPAEIPSLFNSRSILQYHPEPKGCAEARWAIAEHYSKSNRSIDPEDLILTASTSESYSFLFKLLCNPGDEVFIPSPSYPLFDSLAELENVNLVTYSLQYHEVQWKTDFKSITQNISNHCKAIILVSPNNPTGHIHAKEELDQFLKIATEYNLAIIIDEVFCEYLFETIPYPSLNSSGPLVFTLNGFSKMLGLPQFKIGWIHVSGRPTWKKQALENLEWMADAYLSVNGPVQLVTPKLLGLVDAIQSEIKTRLQNNLNFSEQTLIKASKGTDTQNPGFEIFRPQGGWCLMIQIPFDRITSEDFAISLVEKTGIYVHPGSLFGMHKNCTMVLSLLIEENIFSEGLRGLLLFSRELISNSGNNFGE
jgi:alanine-synthesizing transaminase